MTYRACVLGATGLVGQRFVSILASHPWFDLEILCASDKYAGKSYGECVRWMLEDPPPRSVEDLKLYKVDPKVIMDEKPDIVFSALSSDVAEVIEVELVKRGLSVVSNASPMRMDPHIPLLNPEVNAHHINIVGFQRRRGWKGALLKVPNCTTAILTLSLKPIMDEFGMRRIIVSTMQAVSGGGIRGVSSVEIIDNVIPYIRGEEEKVESETLKILGDLSENGIRQARIKVSASCHRVMVLDGHLESVFIETKRKADVEEVITALEEFRSNMLKGLNLPSAPKDPIIVRREPDRPQPRLDRFEGRGMSIVVGRIREDKALGGLKFIVLGHNTIRGAAGTAVLIGELLVEKGIIG